MKKTLIAFLIFASASLVSFAQSNKVWNGKKCAVVLTYDDGLNIDLKNVIPALDSVGLKGTFYIADFGNFNTQIPGWKKAAAEGHELANHTIWHPCEGGRAGREFVKDYDLRFYTVKRIDDEIREMNNILKTLDGRDKRTFAFPCGDTRIGDTPYINPVKNLFVAARGVNPSMPKINEVDLYNAPCYMINGQTGQQLVELVKKATNENALLVFLFHGVGGEHSLNVSLDAHHELLRYLKQNQKEIWIAPMIDVAEFIKGYQAHSK
jgi:peptidoglycan/xylan/chitin deacetylase (PgdA/CDA1 family)